MTVTKEQQQKLVFAQGMLAGIEWLVDNNKLAEALTIVREQIEKVLEENDNA